MITNNRATAGNAALVFRINLSPNLLARGACTIGANLAAGPGNTITHNGQQFSRDRIRVVLLGQSCAVSRGR